MTTFKDLDVKLIADMHYENIIATIDYIQAHIQYATESKDDRKLFLCNSIKDILSRRLKETEMIKEKLK